METRMLGKTGLQVTVLGYGAMAINRGPESGLSDEHAGQVLGKVLDSGINFIDTAPDYGHSEEWIGKHISHRRGEYYLSTKCGCNVPREGGDDAAGHIWDRETLMRNIELSLKRMKTDYVDIWQLHNAGVSDVEQGDILQVMKDVKTQGKVRHVSISSTLPHITTYVEKGWFDTYQIPYSGLQREEEASITAVAESGAGTIIRGGVAKGEPEGDLAEHDRWKTWAAAGLDELLSEGESRSAFLLRFTISHPHMHTTIVGTQNLDHLTENVRAVEAGRLSAEAYEEAKRRLAGVENGG